MTLQENRKKDCEMNGGKGIRLYSFVRVCRIHLAQKMTKEFLGVGVEYLK